MLSAKAADKMFATHVFKLLNKLNHSSRNEIFDAKEILIFYFCKKLSKLLTVFDNYHGTHTCTFLPNHVKQCITIFQHSNIYLKCKKGLDTNAWYVIQYAIQPPEILIYN